MSKKFQNEVLSGLQDYVDRMPKPEPFSIHREEPIVDPAVMKEVAARYYGIPPQHADRINGTSWRDIKADAAELADVMEVKPEKYVSPLGSSDNIIGRQPGDFQRILNDVLMYTDDEGWAHIPSDLLDDMFRK